MAKSLKKSVKKSLKNKSRRTKNRFSRKVGKRRNGGGDGDNNIEVVKGEVRLLTPGEVSIIPPPPKRRVTKKVTKKVAKNYDDDDDDDDEFNNKHFKDADELFSTPSVSYQNTHHPRIEHKKFDLNLR